MPPAERHLVLTAAVKSIDRSFKRRRLVPVLPALSWKGGGGKAVLHGDDRYKEADAQNGQWGWRILEELLVSVNDARAYHLHPPKEAIGLA